MGGKPLLALNIVCFPDNRINDLEEIIKGGLEKITEAGAILVGGHSIKDKEPKYGLAVLGVVDPEKVIKNHTPQDGDSLILTKALGTGIISTALKDGIVSEDEVEETIKWMAKLNSIPETVLDLSIHSMTDITGFGFIGHLNEMLVDDNLIRIAGTGIYKGDVVPVLRALCETKGAVICSYAKEWATLYPDLSSYTSFLDAFRAV